MSVNIERQSCVMSDSDPNSVRYAGIGTVRSIQE